MPVEKTQSFVIGGYTIGGSTFDAVVFGYYDQGKLIYASRSRNGFTPVSRADLLTRMKPLEVRNVHLLIFLKRRKADGVPV